MTNFSNNSKIALDIGPNIEKMTDEKLLFLCRKYGEEALKWRQKFVGLLPEVDRRKLYEKKGFKSIFEFAAKLAGVSADQVQRTLKIEERLEDKPILKSMLVNGEISIHKLARIISIVTPENERELAEKIKILPKAAIETLVRDEKIALKEVGELKGGKTIDCENKNAFMQPLFEDKSVPGHNTRSEAECGACPSRHSNKKSQTDPAPKLNFELSPKIIQKLNELQAKGIDPNEILRTLLQKREDEIVAAKSEISTNIKPTTSRYIPVKIKKIIKQEFGEKCSIQTCQKPAKTIHHAQRFSLAHSHDPHYLAPLCREHHIIAHTVDLNFHQARNAFMRGT